MKRKKDRRPSEALNEEDKERKKKESLKTVCSSQRRFSERNRVSEIEEARSLKEDIKEDKENQLVLSSCSCCSRVF